MRQTKNSNIPWIGIIPDDWTLIKGKYVFAQKNERGNSIDLLLLSPTQKYGVIPQSLYEELTGMNAVKLKESINLESLKTIHKGGFCISLRSFQGGFEYSEYEGVVSPAYQVFYPTTSIIDQYYKYLFKDNSFIEKMNSYTMSLRDGKNIAFEDFGNTVIPVPPIGEQKLIAEFLDDKCGTIDSLISDLQEQVEVLEQYRRSVITEAVTYGLNPQTKTKDSGLSWIAEIPDGWRVSRFKHIAQVCANLVSPDKYMDYPQISPDCIEKNSGRLLSYNTVEESGIISDNHLFYKGQIVYSKIRPKLNKVIVAPFDGLCSADMYPIETTEMTEFVRYMMLSHYFVQQVSLISEDRVKMPKINQDELGEIKVIIPPLETQIEIVKYLDNRLDKVDDLLSLIRNRYHILQDYKKSIIYEFVTGKKEVPV